MSDHPPTSSLFHRLREWFGLAPGSVREDIEEALEETDLGVISPLKSERF